MTSPLQPNQSLPLWYGGSFVPTHGRGLRQLDPRLQSDFGRLLRCPVCHGVHHGSQGSEQEVRPGEGEVRELFSHRGGALRRGGPQEGAGGGDPPSDLLLGSGKGGNFEEPQPNSFPF